MNAVRFSIHTLRAFRNVLIWCQEDYLLNYLFEWCFNATTPECFSLMVEEYQTVTRGKPTTMCRQAASRPSQVESERKPALAGFKLTATTLLGGA